jgi:TrmH family RNA methyltransferase
MRRSPTDVRELVRSGTLALVLESVQDPGNLGSIVRSADAAGCQLCFVTGPSVDPYHPRAVRATMGSIFRLPLIRAESDSALRALADDGFELIGADPHDGETYDTCDLTGRVALVLGGESAGLNDAVRARLSRTVRVPMREGVESLSVAAAAAVLLFETARQGRR